MLPQAFCPNRATWSWGFSYDVGAQFCPQQLLRRRRRGVMTWGSQRPSLERPSLRTSGRRHRGDREEPWVRAATACWRLGAGAPRAEGPPRVSRWAGEGVGEPAELLCGRDRGELLEVHSGASTVSIPAGGGEGEVPKLAEQELFLLFKQKHILNIGDQ